MMLKTANQRLAMLVLAGGAVALVALLLLAFTLPQRQPDLANAWFTANFIFIYALTAGAFYEIGSYLGPYTHTAIVTMSALIVSYGLGLFLALRVLLRGGRSMRWLRAFFTRNRLSAALAWVGAVSALGGMAWFMSNCAWYLNFCELSLISGLPMAWMDIQYMILSPITDLFDPLPSYFDHAAISRGAYLTTAALALSYVLCLALAVGTLWQGRRTPDTTAE